MEEIQQAIQILKERNWGLYEISIEGNPIKGPLEEIAIAEPYSFKAIMPYENKVEEAVKQYAHALRTLQLAQIRTPQGAFTVTGVAFLPDFVAVKKFNHESYLQLPYSHLTKKFEEVREYKADTIIRIRTEQ